MISPPRARVATKRSRANASQPANPCRPHLALSHVTGTMYCPETSRSPASAASPPAPRQPRKRGRGGVFPAQSRPVSPSPPPCQLSPMLRVLRHLGPPGTCPLAPCALPPLESETAKRRPGLIAVDGRKSVPGCGQVHGAGAERS